MLFLNNPWVVTIIGGIVVYFLTRGRLDEQRSSIITTDSLLAILLFLFLQTGIPIFAGSIFKSIIAEFGMGFYLIFYEIVVVIVTVTVIERRKRNKKR